MRKFDETSLSTTSANVMEAIRRATFDTSAWDDFVKTLSTAFSENCIAFQRIDTHRNQVDYDRILNLDPDSVASYRQYYCGINPWIPPMRSARSGALLVSEQIYPAASFRHTEFYNDWLKPEVEATAAMILEAGAGNLAVVAAHYPVAQAVDYDSWVSAVFQRIRKPLRRSFETARMLEQVVERERSAAAIIARSHDVACVVDRDLHVLDANEPAERQFRRRELVLMRSGRFSVLNAEVNSWLSDTLSLLAIDAEPETMTSIFLAGETYQLGITPIPEVAYASSPFSRGRLFLIILRCLSHQAGGSALAELAATFSLTPAELRLCEALSLGNTLKESAEMLEVTAETARQRLKTVFQKTDTHRQSDLIMLFNRSL